MATGKILVVDDEPILRMVTSEILTSSGYEVLQAQDGLEALETYQALHEDIALVLMDLMMPRMDGLEASRRIREVDPEAKILLTSGFTCPPLSEVPPTAFLPKPYTFAVLRQMVQDLLCVRTGAP